MLDAVRRIYGAPSIELLASNDESWSRYSLTDKKRVLTLLSTGHNFADVEKITGVSRSTARLWYKKYKSAGTLKNTDELYVKNISRIATKGPNKIRAKERQNSLVGFVTGRSLNVESLVDLLFVTAATVRTDIKCLIEEGRIANISNSPSALEVIANG